MFRHAICTPNSHIRNPGTIFGAFYSVAAYKKKIVAFLVAVALVSPSVCLGQTDGFANDPNYSLSSANSPGTLAMFFKMMLSVLLVVALGAAAIYISKKFLPSITNPNGKKIRVIETAHIGPRKMVHLLKIGNQQLLIGSTSENITKLADVTDALSEMDLSATKTDNN
ncbi:hypothetical protein ES703_59914 [subsurface metagenome]